MTTDAIRLATWADIQEHIQGRRLAALQAFREHGPGTTREVAERSRMDLLTLRPRVTELYQLGFIRLVSSQKPAINGGQSGQRGHEGIYEAISDEQALADFNARNAADAADDKQLPLKL